MTPSREELRAADRAARRTARTTFDRPVVLEAGAGTGKTATLVARILTWALGPGWERVHERLAPAQGSAQGSTERADQQVERTASAVLGGIAAITFTEAAAAEMSERVALSLARLVAGEVPTGMAAEDLPPAAVRTARAHALLGTLDHLVVRTIHAFCRGLLAAWPVESARHPAFTVDADGRLVEGLVSEVVEASLRTVYGDPGDPDLLALAARGIGPPQLVEALVALVQQGLPAAALADDPCGPAAAAALRDRLATAAAEVHGILSECLRQGRCSPTAHALEEGLDRLRGRLVDLGPAHRGLRLVTGLAGRLEAGRPEASLPAVVESSALLDLRAAAAEHLPEKLVERLQQWAKGKLTGVAEENLLSPVRAPLAAACAELAPLLRHLAKLDPELLGEARRGLLPLLRRVEEEMRSRGIETFQGLLAGAASLLAGHPEVAARERRRIDQLLVDEFQDTDVLQCELLARLALDGALDGPPAERPGLFLVGDPKQSIYGWRSADLAAYDGFLARVSAAGGTVHTLSENFRSVPAVLAEVERTIAPVMPAIAGVQPPFVPLLPCPEKELAAGFVRRTPRQRRPVEHWAAAEERASATALATEREAAALAADLIELHATGSLAWKDVGVLLRSTGDLDIYLEALRRANIPYQVGRDRQYYRRREVIDAAALVRAVLDPGDHLALLTWLRSPVVGVPDAALVPLWNRRFPQAVTELTGELTGSDPGQLAALRALIAEAARALPAGIPGLAGLAGWEHALVAAVGQLAELRRSFAEDPADLFVERLRRLTLVEAVEAARYLGAYRLANLDRFFRQLRTALDEGDVTAVLRLLRQSVAVGQDAEEAQPRQEGEDAVSVLTIHGAKGLDFAHVYLLQLHKLTDVPDKRAETRVGRLPGPRETADDGPAEYRLFGAATPGWAEVEARRERVEAAERVRLLYVAMTRAKDRLVLAGSWPEGEGGPRPPERARSHVDLLRHRTGLPADGFAALRAVAAAAEGAAHGTALDGDDILWRFPDLEAAEEPAATLWQERSREQPPDAATARRSAALYADLRQEAGQRMARRWSAAASEEAHEQLREVTAVRRFAEAGTAAESAGVHEGGEPALGDPRAAAMAAGGAVHRALETWDLAAEPAAELARQTARLPASLAALGVGEADRGRALRRARTALDAFAQGPLLPRLAALRKGIVARELPVLLPPRENADDGPVGFVAGAIDLLYRDPQGGGMVIADYKTDEADEEALPALAAAYAHQGAVYVRAVQQALGLPAAPRFELWFLRAGVVVGAEGV
jgi:ATP-dependent helicase/nuclease subunit A